MKTILLSSFNSSGLINTNNDYDINHNNVKNITNLKFACVIYDCGVGGRVGCGEEGTPYRPDPTPSYSRGPSLHPLVSSPILPLPAPTLMLY